MGLSLRNVSWFFPLKVIYFILLLRFAFTFEGEKGGAGKLSLPGLPMDRWQVPGLQLHGRPHIAYQLKCKQCQKEASDGLYTGHL
jgi:hypothetical protein